MQLTQKEKELLKDLKGQEKLCVEKYSQARGGGDGAEKRFQADLFGQRDSGEEK